MKPWLRQASFNTGTNCPGIDGLSLLIEKRELTTRLVDSPSKVSSLSRCHPFFRHD